MPAIYAACHRVLREVRRRLPEFAPAQVLDFGAGPSSALWAMRAVWPKSIKRVNQVEPSKEMQRAGQSLLDNLKGLPLIHSYDSIQELNHNIEKHERGHDLVISSYALREIPSLSDRITIVRAPASGSDERCSGFIGAWNASRSKDHKPNALVYSLDEKASSRPPSNMKSAVAQETLLKNGSFVVAPCPSY